MRLRSRTKSVLVASGAIAALIGLSFPVRAYVWLPYQAKHSALSLPSVPPNLTNEDLGIPPSGAAFNCATVPTTLLVSELQVQSASLASAARALPSDLCIGNQFRESVRYLTLRTGQFAIKTTSLPPELSPLAKDANSLPAEEGNNSNVSPDDLEPAKLFRSLTASSSTDSPEAELQLGLSYVDLMIQQGGRENKARLSRRSIEALTSALERRPYLIAALYARGLNYLYWPPIAGKLPLAVRDLKLCISLSFIPSLKEKPPVVIAEAYRALGDTYVKFADSTTDKSTEKALLQAGRSWWEKGHERFPYYSGFDERMRMPMEGLSNYVDSARGLETYINTDLDLLWTK